MSHVAPTIWELFTNFHVETFPEEITRTLNRLYLNASEAHQHILLDVLANTTYRTSKYDQNATTWNKRSLVEPENTAALSVAMRALTQPYTLNTPNIYNYCTPAQLNSIRAEIAEHHEWVTKHPYLAGTCFTQEMLPEVTNYTRARQFTQNLTLLALSKPEVAPILWDFKNNNTKKNFLHRFYHDIKNQVPGALDLYHQNRLVSNTPITTMAYIAFTYCPDTIIHKIWENKPLTSEEYGTWVEVMEKKFPIRHLTYKALQDDGLAYHDAIFWELDVAVGKLQQPKFLKNRALKYGTRQWLEQKIQQTFEETMTLEYDYFLV